VALALQAAVSENRNFLSAIKNCFYLATGISPLLMLVPKKYNDRGFRRDSLIAVCSSCPQRNVSNHTIYNPHISMLHH
jgi:hypothetical protein